MDFDYAFWQMLQVCVAPARVYRSTLYHRRTKHQWARDDPVFAALLVCMLALAVLAWSIALGLRTTAALELTAYIVAVDFLLAGAAIAGLCSTASN